MKENYVQIRGNVGSDAKVVITENETKMTILSVAISNNKKDKDSGEWTKRDPIWIDVLCFNSVAEKATVIQKGERVTVEGRLSVVTNKNEKGENFKSLTFIATDIERASILKNLSLGTSIDEDTIDFMSNEAGL
jgi:single stranded DNA-binding protein